MHAYEYLPVRLAVPLPWETRLISNLPKYLAVEVPLTLLSLLALPMLLSFQRHRSLYPTFSTWSTVYHLLSGDDRNSLISTAKRGAFILLVSGIVSLLLQYPINLLKGEVVSSPYEQRVQPSTCEVNACRFSGVRKHWFEDKDGFVGRLRKEENLTGAVNERKLKSGCSNISESSSEMNHMTVLAFLTQYLTVCDDPALMKMRLAKWGRTLAFDSIPGSHDTQAMCSYSDTAGAHIEPTKHFYFTRWILEHGLLKYPHMKSSLYRENTYDKDFWLPGTELQGRQVQQVREKIGRAIKALEGAYDKYEMLQRREDTAKMTLEELRHIFLTFVVAVLSITGYSLVGWCLLRARQSYNN